MVHLVNSAERHGLVSGKGGGGGGGALGLGHKEPGPQMSLARGGGGGDGRVALRPLLGQKGVEMLASSY